MYRNEVIVAGAGAAGLMAAVRAAQRGAKVLLLERNDRPGVKLSITGKGRCNITNDCDAEEILQNCNDRKFLRSALSRFSPQDTMAFFEGLGVPLATERGRRVFPQSGQAADIVNALVREAEKLGVQRRRQRVTAIPEGRPVIIATGGLSYPKTGSTGDGYELARLAGHTVTPLSPSLVPLNSPDTLCGELQGLSLRNVTLRLLDSAGKTVFCEGPGEMLFTHFGISGPLVLTASCYIQELPATLHIDLKPALEKKMLDSRILREFSQGRNRQFKNSLDSLLPAKLISEFVKRSCIPPEKQINAISRAERHGMVELFKAFPQRVTAVRPIDEAVITDGGICVKEIDPKTMQSKLVKGLYFIGEVIDVTGFTGGFNLQIVWSTAHSAAISIMSS
jgi:hypothetical protein